MPSSLSTVPSRDLDELDRLLLAAVGPVGAPLDSLPARTRRPPEVVADAFHHLLRAGLVEVADDTARLTPRGRLAVSAAAADGRSAAARGAGPVDLEEAVRTLGSVLSTHAQGRAAAAEAARDEVLASDGDRDDAVRLLADAVAHGRLTPEEFEDRTGRALVARTHGELDDLLKGLGGYRTVAPRHPVRKGVFAVMAFFSSPFVLMGAMLLLFGTDVGDRVGGVFFLVLLLPGLFGLWRWAWPRRR